MERISWREHFLKHPQHLLHTRIFVGEERGTVRFTGPLEHEGRPANSENELWVGVEWDNLKRGKNNGVVGGHQYFTTKGDEKSGSLLKFNKLEFGESFFYAFLSKYIKKEDQLAKLEECLSQNRTEKGEEKLKDLKKEMPKIEYDNDAFFETTLHKKRLVEFIGFDRIWQKIEHPQSIKEISLSHLKICDIGLQGSLSQLFTNLRVLSLQDNLLNSWDQVFLLGHELIYLKELSLNSNFLQPLTQPVTQKSVIRAMPSKQPLELCPLKIFKALDTLILMSMRLSWRQTCFILPAFPCLSEIALCKNPLTDWDRIEGPILHEALKNVQVLNLDQTELHNISNLSFLKQTKLKKLSLNRNHLVHLQDLPVLHQLRALYLDHNAIDDPIAISRISAFKMLSVLSIRHNPMVTRLGSAYVRQRAIGELAKLMVMNGSDLQKYERKDAEIFYMKKSFEEYFARKGADCYDYDVEDFNKYKGQHHPNLDRLIAIYGNPYPSQSKDIVQLIKQEEKQLKAAKPTGMAHIEVDFREVKSTVRIPVTWKGSSTRNYFAKTHKLPAGRLRMMLKSSEQEEWIEPQDHKEMYFYGLRDGSKIRLQYLS